MESLSLPDGVVVTPLKRIYHPKGNIFHALKCSEKEYMGFGEAYFTTIHPGDIKGWKKHLNMTMNLVVPLGQVIFYLHDEHVGLTTQVVLGESHYARLTVPTGIWMAFQGEKEINLILNIASIEHDPYEAVSAELNSFPFIG